MEWIVAGHLRERAGHVRTIASARAIALHWVEFDHRRWVNPTAEAKDGTFGWE
jgi:hypothetical protein